MRGALAAGALVVVLFVATAPWNIAGREIGRLAVPLAIAFAIIALAAKPLLNAEWHASRRAICVFGLCAFLFLLRITLSQFLSLNVNAWDFSLYFDRPLERTVQGQFLYSDYFHQSTLFAHADFIMLLFVPLYAIRPSPYWLIVGQAAILAAGCCAAFAVFRRILNDDVAALALALAFLLNRYTAKTAQYVFHFEVFYPLMLFLLIYAFLSRRPILLMVSCLLTMAIKQDAILPLAGLGIAFLVFFRRPRAAALILGSAAAGFALDYFIVMPAPWYAWYWSHYGATPLQAAGGMALHPIQLMSDLVHSGAPRLLATLLFVPVVGFEWFVAALPAMIVAGASSFPKLHDFDLYYSMPFLPIVFCAAAAGARRRLIVFALLITSALTGGGYVIPRARPEARRVSAILDRVPPRIPVRVQSALYPHAGYSRDRFVLDRLEVNPAYAYLIDVDVSAYPLTSEQIAILRSNLVTNKQFTETRESGLELFLPNN